MRPGLSLDLPPDVEQRREQAARFRRGPLAHAAATLNEMEWGRLSPSSRRSARTRSAKT
jgi:hypothetical protein